MAYIKMLGMCPGDSLKSRKRHYSCDKSCLTILRELLKVQFSLIPVFRGPNWTFYLEKDRWDKGIFGIQLYILFFLRFKCIQGWAALLHSTSDDEIISKNVSFRYYYPLLITYFERWVHVWCWYILFHIYVLKILLMYNYLWNHVK